jgi:predicted nucleic acid-binding protein
MSEFVFSSDVLNALREFPRGWALPSLSALPVQRLVVVDANFVVRAAVQKSKLRNPRATTVFEEIAASGTWTLIAPPILRREVQTVMKRKSVDPVKAAAVLKELFTCIRFVRVPRAQRSKTGRFASLAARDPNDLPYAWLLEFAAADFIVSADKDLSECGFPVLPIGRATTDVPVEVRNHGRLVADAHGRILMTSAAAQLAHSVARSAYRRIGPGGVLAVAGALFIVWNLLDETQQQKVRTKLVGLRTMVKALGRFLGPVLEHDKKCEQILAGQLPASPLLTLGDALFRLALVRPHSPDEAARKLEQVFGLRVDAAAVVRSARRDSRLQAGTSISVAVRVARRHPDLDEPRQTTPWFTIPPVARRQSSI